MQSNILLYGANGYTGELIARYAGEYHLQPVLAGRNKEAVGQLAQRLNLPYRIINLDDNVTLKKALADVKVVIHAAGPFKNTAKQMIEACLETGTHYTDINGDISVFEIIKSYDAAAKNAGIMLMPGTGFDVVPTDCMALFLKNKLPDATHLKIAFASPGGNVSHGTAITMAGKLGEGGMVRENGQILKKPLGHKGMWVDFLTPDGEKKLFVMTIPWGDISTAYHTTGIPNTETYTGMKPAVYRMLKFQFMFNWLLRTSWLRNFVIKKINQRPAGPEDDIREKTKSLIWAEANNKKGERVSARMYAPDGYTITAVSSLLIARKIVMGEFKPGYQTPAGVYGENLVMEIPGVHREIQG
ncbi:MAG: saccharopine dehydrogenase NADP-binding domain-containing protein [Chitinophagaceae bacterium]|nr:saccharopine dehydrogenase NADP-binding domain-containing protein [Chitinophagaceae bacterium]